MFFPRRSRRPEASLRPKQRTITPPAVTPEPSAVPDDEKVTASLANIPAREDMLRQVVASLLPQVDRLNVYLNGWDRVPEFLNDPKIVVARSQDHGDRGDAGKFFWADDIQGYHYTCDDDLLYPPAYVAVLKAAIERTLRKAAVGFLGMRVRQPFVSSRESLRFIPFDVRQTCDQYVHYLGTGVLAYHTSTLRVSRDDFPLPNMADIWFGVLLQAQQVPALCPSRPAKWIVPLPSTGDTIWGHSQQGTPGHPMNTTAQAEQVLRSRAWATHQLPGSGVPVVPPPDRPEQSASARPSQSVLHLANMMPRRPPPVWGPDIDETVTASLASLPARVHTLVQTVESLLPQVDRLNVMLNGWDYVPAFLAHPKITVGRSQECGDHTVMPGSSGGPTK